MREVMLRLFFQGHATAAELARDLEGTRAEDEHWAFRASTNYRVEPMAVDFELVPAHMVRIVDAALAGALTEDDLGTLCFALECSERFWWDAETGPGARVDDAIFWLGTPQIRGTERNPLHDNVTTVGDLVHFLAHQPCVRTPS